MYLLKATDQGKGKTRYGYVDGYRYGDGYVDGYDHGYGHGYGYGKDKTRYGDGYGYGYGYGKLTFTPEQLLLLMATEVASVPT